MRRYYLLYGFVLLIIGLAACSRSDSPAPGNGPHIIDFNDNTTPVVEIYSPINNQVLASGDTIKITGRITDNSLYQGFIRITNDAGGTVIKEQLYEIHGLQSYNFYLDHKTSVSTTTDYTVTVQFMDHGHNTGSQFVKVKVNP